MTFCTRECSPDCLKEKLEMARRIEELKKYNKELTVRLAEILVEQLEFIPYAWIYSSDGNAVVRIGNNKPDARESWIPVYRSFAHPNQSIGEQK